MFAVRSSEHTVPLFERTLESSSQLAVRWILVLVFALALLAFELGLDLLLGGFAAGMITRQVLKTRELPAFDSKLTAVAFGVFVPFFFVVSGMNLDLSALFASVGSVVKMFALPPAVPASSAGVPGARALPAGARRRDRIALALLTSTQLPLVLAITTIAVESGHMRPVTAAALEGAAVLSTLGFPMLGLRLRGDLEQPPGPPGAARAAGPGGAAASP